MTLNEDLSANTEHRPERICNKSLTKIYEQTNTQQCINCWCSWISCVQTFTRTHTTSETKGEKSLTIEFDWIHKSTSTCQKIRTVHTRVPFGLSSAPAAFQGLLSKVLAGLPGCANLMDDILVFGKDMEHHNRCL